MTIIQAVILGIVEGFTEFLPISSTGHMILASKIMGIADVDFTKSFEIIVQFGAILAVVFLYFTRIWQSKDLWKKTLTAFLPTAFIGFLLYRFLKEYLLGNALVVVWAFLLGGVALIVFEIWQKRSIYYKNQSFENRSIQEISYKQSFLTGAAQVLAIIPGVSRSAATIVAGMAMGISRQAIVEFSFLLAIPTLAAATGYDLYKNASSFSFDQFWVLAVGFIVSFVVAIISIKWLLSYVKNHTFIAFGVYRIIVALAFWVLVSW